jgi:hypothetical protein
MQIREYSGQVITEPGIYANVPMAKYHSGKLCAGPSISSSGLRKIFSESEMAYWVESPLNPNRLIPKEKEAFILGRATHHLALGEAHFHKQFTIRPETLDGSKWNGNRHVCQNWEAQRQLEGLTILTPGQKEQILGMAGVLPWQANLEDSGLANSRMVQDGILNGMIEHTIAFQDQETGIWLLSRPDAIPLDSTMNGDLKTTEDVSFSKLEMTISDWRYDMQAALARWALRVVCNIELTNFALVFVMKQPPHAVRVIEIKHGDMDEAEKDLRVAIRAFARGIETGRWPGPGGTQMDAMFVGVTKWARDRANARRAFLEQELAP